MWGILGEAMTNTKTKSKKMVAQYKVGIGLLISGGGMVILIVTNVSGISVLLPSVMLMFGGAIIGEAQVDLA